MPRAPLSIEWIGGIDGCVRLIDQTRLPDELVFLDCRGHRDGLGGNSFAARARRGRPSALRRRWGSLWAYENMSNASSVEFTQRLQDVAEYCSKAGRRAVNLAWAIRRMTGIAGASQSPTTMIKTLWHEAVAIRDEDAAMCRAMGRAGAGLIASGDGILTHCNTGGLATAEFGTALAVLFTASEQGKEIHVFADETRHCFKALG